jgi:hypothetical protein
VVAHQNLPTQTLALSQDGPQPHPYPTVGITKRTSLAVFEVCIPASQGAVHLHDDLRHTFAIVARRLASERFFEFLEAALPPKSWTLFLEAGTTEL